MLKLTKMEKDYLITYEMGFRAGASEMQNIIRQYEPILNDEWKKKMKDYIKSLKDGFIYAKKMGAK